MNKKTIQAEKRRTTVYIPEKIFIKTLVYGAKNGNMKISETIVLALNSLIGDEKI